VEAKGRGLLVVNNIDTPYVPSDDSANADASRVAGALVLDRFLVQPGDTLHVTGAGGGRGRGLGEGCGPQRGGGGRWLGVCGCARSPDGAWWPLSAGCFGFSMSTPALFWRSGQLRLTKD
jgi:hypothetical protein